MILSTQPSLRKQCTAGRFKLHIVVMSDTSIHFKDEGYTSPDFLTNLFRKPLYSSLTTYQTSSSRETPSATKQNDAPVLERRLSSPLKFKTNYANISKNHRSLPAIDEQRIACKKYKIFFKAVMHGALGQEEMNVLWSRLEEALPNPYAFDQLVEEIQRKKDEEMQIKLKNDEPADSVIQKSKRENPREQAKTPQKERQGNKYFASHEGKHENNRIRQEQIRRIVKDQLLSIKSLLIQGQKQIRQK